MVPDEGYHVPRSVGVERGGHNLHLDSGSMTVVGASRWVQQNGWVAHHDSLGHSGIVEAVHGARPSCSSKPRMGGSKSEITSNQVTPSLTPLKDNIQRFYTSPGSRRKQGFCKGLEKNIQGQQTFGLLYFFVYSMCFFVFVFIFSFRLLCVIRSDL